MVGHNTTLAFSLTTSLIPKIQSPALFIPTFPSNQLHLKHKCVIYNRVPRLLWPYIILYVIEATQSKKSKQIITPTIWGYNMRKTA